MLQNGLKVLKINDLNISEVSKKSILDAAEWFRNLEKNLDKRQFKIAEHVLKEINERLNFLLNVGLDYLTLSRESGTLSGGEAQRIKLAKELSKRPTGRTLYILDEPTTGLHSHDIKKLLEILQAFANTGNTVVVIEHNLDVIKTADYIVDMGPEGGVNGGKIIAEGTPEKVSTVKESYTGKFIKEIMGENAMKKTA